MQILKSFGVLFALLISTNLFASQYPEPLFDSPRSTMNYFLKTMKGHKLGDENALNLAVTSLNLSKLDETTRLASGQLAAKRLINTLDRLEYIKIENIPIKLEGTSWVYQKKSVSLDGKSYPVEIAIGKTSEGKWLFTPDTVKTIHNFEASLKNKKVVEGVKELSSWKTQFKKKMPAWTGKRSFVLLNGQWLGIFIIIFIALIFERVIRFIVARVTNNILARKNISNFDSKKTHKFIFPIGLLTFAAFWTMAIRVLELTDDFLSPLLRGGYVVFTLACVMTAFYIVDVLTLYLEKKASESENKFDDILVPLIRKTSKFFVIAVGVIFIGDSLTLDMKSILAGLGIGGLAFALAAKDTLSNLFGSLTVLLDRPFRIGDWVCLNGNIEGMVEQVGLRSTRIRTFYNSLITVPNGMLTNIHIDNYGMRDYRRFSTKIGIEYGTAPEKIEAFCEGIRQIILTHKWTRKDSFHVYLNGMGAHSLDILLYVFWRVPDWSQELNEKHRLLMDIIRLGKELDVNFAFPTQTLHILEAGKVQEDSWNHTQDYFTLGKDKAKNLAQNTLTPSSPRSTAQEGDKLGEATPSL